MTMKRLLAGVAGALVLVAAFAIGWHQRGEVSRVEDNVETSFSPRVRHPSLHRHDFVHPLAAVIGAVELGDDVFVAPGASVRGDEGQPIYIGAGSNIQDGVVVHALETFDDGHPIESNLVVVRGRAPAVA